MTPQYPSLPDPDSSADDLTYVSEHLGNHNSLWDLHFVGLVGGVILLSQRKVLLIRLMYF